MSELGRPLNETVFCLCRPPVSNDPRYVTMVKGVEPIGISIVSGEHGGIFVSRLTDNSLASKAGLEYGDQLLEVGWNMYHITNVFWLTLDCTKSLLF